MMVPVIMSVPPCAGETKEEIQQKTVPPRVVEVQEEMQPQKASLSLADHLDLQAPKRSANQNCFFLGQPSPRSKQAPKDDQRMKEQLFKSTSLSKSPDTKMGNATNQVQQTKASSQMQPAKKQDRKKKRKDAAVTTLMIRGIP